MLLVTHRLVDTPGPVARCTVGSAVTMHHRYTTDRSAITVTEPDRIAAEWFSLMEGFGRLSSPENSIVVDRRFARRLRADTL